MEEDLNYFSDLLDNDYIPAVFSSGPPKELSSFTEEVLAEIDNEIGRRAAQDHNYSKKEDIKSACYRVVENCDKVLDDTEYVQTFNALNLRYDQHQDKLKDRDRTTLDNVPCIARNSRYRHDQRQLDEEGEKWFNEDDVFDDGEAVVPATNNILGKNIDSDLDTLGKIIHKKMDGNGPKLLNNSSRTGYVLSDNLSNTTGGSPPSPASGDVKSSTIFKKALVDYEGDSDEDDEDEGNDVLTPSPKRARLT